MKKLLIVLFASLIATSIFAAGAFPAVLNQLPQSSKLELQIRILTVMDHLQFTTSQASALANAMIEFKKDIDSLQQQRTSSLTALRDALLSSNKDALLKARKNLEEVSKSYLKATEKFKDSVESIVTLKQAIMAREWFRSFVESRKGPLQNLLKDFISKRRPIPLRSPQSNAPKAPAERMRPQKGQMQGQMKPQAKPQMRPPMERKPGMFSQQTGRLPVIAEISRKEDALYLIVNSEFYNMIVKTLQMKVAAAK